MLCPVHDLDIELALENEVLVVLKLLSSPWSFQLRLFMLTGPAQVRYGRAARSGGKTCRSEDSVPDVGLGKRSPAALLCSEG